MRGFYEQMLGAVTDIQGHLEFFARTVADLDARKVIELGTRAGVSSVAFLYALELTGGELWSVDLDPGPPELAQFAHWHFVQGDDTNPEVLDQLPTGVDIVFIDTSHAYDHTLHELETYYPRVRSGGKILLHDTELETPDFVGPQPPFPVRLAVEEFCAKRGLGWTNYRHSYGLGVVEVR